MTALQLFTKITSLPKELRQKVGEYIAFLQFQAQTDHNGKVRVPGLAKGKIKMKDNFDDPMEDFKEYI